MTNGRVGSGEARLWNRLLRQGLIRPPELVRAHREAQRRRTRPEEAAVSLGIVTRDQVGDASGSSAWTLVERVFEDAPASTLPVLGHQPL